MTIAEKILRFYWNLQDNWELPESFDLIYPLSTEETRNCISAFYRKYFNDYNPRYIILGINPGRFGAGITGIPFTDPKILESHCDVNNSFQKKNELSSQFVYEFIEGYGGINSFYADFFLSSVCPLGFITGGINCNYYDDKELYNAVKPNIVRELWNQIDIGINRKAAFILGKGLNYKYMNHLNNENNFFEQIIPLPHPRWVMQYQRKNKDRHLQNIVSALKNRPD